jgi:hypothetical protein
LTEDPDPRNARFLPILRYVLGFMILLGLIAFLLARLLHR